MSEVDTAVSSSNRSLRWKMAAFLGLLASAVLTCQHPGPAVGMVLVGVIVAGLLHCRFETLAKLGVYVVVAAIPFDTVTRTMWNPLTTLPKLVFAPAFAMFVASYALDRRPLVSGGRTMWAATAFFGSVLLSALLTGGDSSAKAQAVLTAMGVFLFFILAINVVTSERDLHQLLWLIVISNAVSAAVSLGSGVFGFSFLGLSAGARLEGLMGVANTVGSVAMTGLCFVPYVFTTARHWWTRGALLFLALAMLLAVLGSLSRFAVLSLFASLLYAGLRWRCAPRVLAIALPLVLAAALLQPVRFQNMLDRMTVVVQVEKLSFDRTFRQRAETLQAGWRMFLDSPIWGIGPGQFLPEYASDDYRDIAMKRNLVLHNAYLRALCEQGLIGCVALILLFAFAFRDLQTATRLRDVRTPALRGPTKSERGVGPGQRPRLWLQEASTEVALVAAAVSGLSQPSLYAKYVWLLFALSAVVRRLDRSARENPSLPPAAAAVCDPQRAGR
jgi:O-antigen ligase